MTKEEIAYKETSGIFDEHELGITGLANAMEIYAKQVSIQFAKYVIENSWQDLYGDNKWVVGDDYKEYTDDGLYEKFKEKQIP